MVGGEYGFVLVTVAVNVEDPLAGELNDTLGTVTLRINITPVPDAPRPTDDEITITEDATVIVNVLANDEDPDAGFEVLPQQKLRSL